MKKEAESLDAKTRRFKIIELLETEYQDAKTSLKHKNPLELLVATILSAQCTDTRVNIVTKSLFKKYRNAEDYAKADLEELGEDHRRDQISRSKPLPPRRLL